MNFPAQERNIPCSKRGMNRRETLPQSRFVDLRQKPRNDAFSRRLQDLLLRLQCGITHNNQHPQTTGLAFRGQNMAAQRWKAPSMVRTFPLPLENARQTPALPQEIALAFETVCHQLF